MTREKSLKLLFAGLAACAITHILREPFGGMVYKWYIGPWEDAVYYFFEDRWAFAVSVLWTIYFAYLYYRGSRQNP